MNLVGLMVRVPSDAKKRRAHRNRANAKRCEEVLRETLRACSRWRASSANAERYEGVLRCVRTRRQSQRSRVRAPSDAIGVRASTRMSERGWPRANAKRCEVVLRGHLATEVHGLPIECEHRVMRRGYCVVGVAKRVSHMATWCERQAMRRSAAMRANASVSRRSRVRTPSDAKSCCEIPSGKASLLPHGVCERQAMRSRVARAWLDSHAPMENGVAVFEL